MNQNFKSGDVNKNDDNDNDNKNDDNDNNNDDNNNNNNSVFIDTLNKKQNISCNNIR